MEKYYTQRLARQWAWRIVPIPDDLQLKNVLRFRLTEEDFLATYYDLQNILRSVYRGIEKDPTSFGMVTIEIEPYAGAVTPHENKSIKSFGRLADTFRAIAELGGFTSNNKFAVPVAELKARKIPKTEKILSGLAQHGISVQRVEENYIFCCEQNPNIFRVMKSFAESGIGRDIVTTDYRYLVYGRENVVYEPEDIIRLIPEEYSRRLLHWICAKFQAMGYYIKPEFTYNPARIRISKSRCGKESVSIRVERDDRLWIGVRPSAVVNHTELLDAMTENILRQTLTGRDCIHCGWCNDGGIDFTYRGTTYHKCSVICCNFLYSPASEEDCASVMNLIKACL